MTDAGDAEGRPVAATLDADRLARLIETSASAFLRLDRDGVCVYANAQAEAVLHRSPGELVGCDVWREIASDDDPTALKERRRALDAGEAVAFEACTGQAGSWYEVRVTPDEDGLSVFLLDVTDRRVAADRLALVAEVTRALVGNRDRESIASTLAQAVVPELATWAMVALYDDNGVLYEAAAHHHDPGRDEDIRRLEALHPRLVTDYEVIASTTSTGDPVLLTAMAGPVHEGAQAGDEMFQVLERLGCDSTILLPLRSLTRSLGLLTLVNGPDRPALDKAVMSTAVPVADRAGLALENAQLYAQQRRTAEVLQRSLLTPLIQPDDLELAARYLPAADGTEVGGDWYDAFVQPDGSAVVVIGDIIGHDITAAAGMGQLRNLLRGIAYDRTDGPAALLERLDAAVTGLGIDHLATLLVGRLERSESAGAWTFRWSSAGHTPPMMLRAGAVEILATDSDVLLGMGSPLSRTEHTASVMQGDTLLLYTDGLVERRYRGIGSGIDELAGTLVSLVDLPLERMCDELVSQMLTTRPADDVALLAVRVTGD